MKYLPYQESTEDNSHKDTTSALKILDNEKLTLLTIKESDITKNQKNLFSFYLSQIQACEQKLKTFQVTGYILIMFFFILLIIKYSIPDETKLKYYFLLIPSILAIISFTISLNYFLRLKQLIEKDEEEILQNNLDTDNSIGNFLSYLSLNFICMATCSFLMLLSLKLENNLNGVGLNLINIPMYISLGILGFYYVFILPAFILNRYIWAIILLAVYLVNSLVFLILISMKIDYNSETTYFKIFIPLLLCLIIQLVYSINDLISGENLLIFRILNTISFILLIGSFIYLIIILDSRMNDHKVKFTILLSLSFIPLFVDKIGSLFFSNDEGHEKK